MNQHVLRKWAGTLITLWILLLVSGCGMTDLPGGKQFINPADESWSYTNGRWSSAEEGEGWGKVMKGNQAGTRASIETDSPYAALKQRGTGGTITVFVDGKAAVTHEVPQDGKKHILPIYNKNEGWHQIEVAFSGLNSEIDGLYVSKQARVKKPGLPRKKIVVIGHSYAEGCCLQERGTKSFAALVGDLLGMESVNAGIGRTDVNAGGANSGLSRVQKDVIDLKPDYVLAVYGINVLGSINKKELTHDKYEADYRSFITQITDALPDTRVFASGLIAARGMKDKTLAPISRDIERACASNSNCTYIDLAGKWNEGNFDKYLSADGMHPSEEGHVFLAEEYAKAISAVMK
ncbi:SGNH/GDSL hydrolase family protein [Paenibacillus gansuensis]|uniref:SGNH/GDSL hydrolase family protein n=1 Tax=Paenibacillus gansuensis TaxID=306542 RepID=A0ABW5PI04_9BACL